MMYALCSMVVAALLATASASGPNVCSYNSCGYHQQGRQVSTGDIFIEPGREFYVSLPPHICGPYEEPYGFKAIACTTDSLPAMACSHGQDIVQRTGDINSILKLKMIAFCPDGVPLQNRARTQPELAWARAQNPVPDMEIK